MFDIFYFDCKPNLFAHERQAKNIEHAAELSRTKFYWYIYGECETEKFDFDYKPVPWESSHLHVWPNQFYQFGNIYLANKETVLEYKWQFHEDIVPTKHSKNNWKILHPIDEQLWDWTWQPHPLDPPYIYIFGNQWHDAIRMPTLEYHTPGATEYKFLDIRAKLLPNIQNWNVPSFIDTNSVDFTWVPDPHDPPYVYHFPSQHQITSGVTYTVDSSHNLKLVDPFITKALPTKENWLVKENISNFDYSWHPDVTEEPYIYVFGNQHYPGTVMPTVIYTVPGAFKEKFLDYPQAKLSPSKDNWEILEPIAEDEWDWTWQPNPKDPPFIYAFGNQWHPPELKTSIRYVVPGATEIKYMEARTRRLPQPHLFAFNLAVKNFDYSWEPNPFDPPLTYVFGNQWNPAVLEPTVVYNVEGATEVKYMDEPVAQVAQDFTYWELLDNVVEFDYSWRPNPTDPPYIYVFGNQWMPPEIRPALQYRVEGATEKKYLDEPKAKRQGNPELFVVHKECEFDYSWEPDPGSPAYIYIFGNQHWPAEIMPTVEYYVAGATEIKYVDELKATLLPTSKNWNILVDLPLEFDRSWCPDPGDPPYIYQFGNQWYSAEVMPTVEYRVPHATEIKYVDTLQAKLLPIMDRWTVPEEIDSSNIDFSWTPHPKDDPYIHHFGSDYQISTGLTYTVPGAIEPKFEGEPPRLVLEKSSIAVVDIFFVDKNNTFSQVRYNKLKEKYPNVQKIRYANSMLETIKRCVTRSKTRKFWVISSLNTYDNFDFAWHAEPWQNYMTHVFPSQWNKWSDTFLINKYEFERHSRWAKGIEEFPNLNFVKNQTVQSASDGSNIYYVDHGNETDQLRVLQSRFVKIKTTRFVDNYLDTFKRIMATAETEYVWIISSICNYDAFDFTWHPEAWQSEMIHVFPSGLQRRGDTFYIHVESFKKQMYELEMLDWFNVINYCEDQRVYRLDPPVFYYEEDSLVDPVKNTTFNYPYAVFKNRNEGVEPGPNYVYPCLWAAKDRVIEPITSNNCNSVVPREARGYVKTQIYDYPYILKDRTSLHPNKALDIIFISNGEPEEELMYHHTEYMTNSDVKWIRGVDGRVAAYQAAAEASSTPWFFAVFAKLEVVGNSFPWYDWQPDYWQQPKHYIFNAHNPVNGLEYGHQGMIAYNKKLVLENNDPGIDFTLSQPHESVPLLSGVARFNQDPWMTWRTAFREVVKLKHFMATQPTLETEYRLDTWLTVAKGDYAEWCLRGSQDAVDYYQEVNGDYKKLMLSFEWAWLKDRFNKTNNS